MLISQVHESHSRTANWTSLVDSTAKLNQKNSFLNHGEVDIDSPAMRK
jgi:hypothetical protein